MDKNLKKFKENYLNELAPDDNLKDKIKNKLDLKPNLDHNRRILHKKKIKLPLIFGGIGFGSIGLAAVLTVLIVVGIFAVISFRNTPVYKGMTANNLIGDIEKLDGEMDNNFKDQIDDLQEQIGVVVDDKIVCYAKPNEDIVITVQIDNPKSFEILSFTLNGTLYQSYEFVNGSNSTQIKVNFKCQEQSGLQQITIDAIKYVDDTNIKNARFNGEKTINVGIEYQNIPKITFSNVTQELNNFNLLVQIEDIDQLINYDNGFNVYLFDEEKLVAREKATKSGLNIFSFSNLKFGTTYAYAIVGVFDLYDGKGKRASVLQEGTFKTEEGFNYQEPVLTYDSIELNYSKTDKFTGELTNISLYLNNELINSINPLETSSYVFNDLLSNNEYKVVTSYKYQLLENEELVDITKNVEETYKTQERPLPVIEFKDETLTKTSIDFKYEITDTVETNKIKKVEIYIGENQVFSIDKETCLFKNNVLDPLYKCDIEYDTNDLDRIIKVEIYLENDGEKLILFSYNENSCFFNNTLSNNEYKFVITYEYDLKDGAGLHEMTFEKIYKTLPKVTPTASFTTGFYYPTLKSIIATLNVDDIDNILNILSLDVYTFTFDESTKEKSYTFITSITDIPDIIVDKSNPGKGTIDFTIFGLENDDYELVIKYKYDLNDGEGEHLIDLDTINVDNKIVID